MTNTSDYFRAQITHLYIHTTIHSYMGPYTNTTPYLHIALLFSFQGFKRVDAQRLKLGCVRSLTSLRIGRRRFETPTMPLMNTDQSTGDFDRSYISLQRNVTVRNQMIVRSEVSLSSVTQKR